MGTTIESLNNCFSASKVVLHFLGLEDGLECPFTATIGFAFALVHVMHDEGDGLLLYE